MTSPLYHRAQAMLLREACLSEEARRLLGVPADLRRAPEVVYPDDLEGMTIEEVCHYFDALRQAREQGEPAARRQ